MLERAERAGMQDLRLPTCEVRYGMPRIRMSFLTHLGVLYGVAVGWVWALSEGLFFAGHYATKCAGRWVRVYTG